MDNFCQAKSSNRNKYFRNHRTESYSISDEDSIPRPSPSPHSQNLNNIKPAVPELSILMDHQECKASCNSDKQHGVRKMEITFPNKQVRQTNDVRPKSLNRNANEPDKNRCCPSSKPATEFQFLQIQNEIRAILEIQEKYNTDDGDKSACNVHDNSHTCNHIRKCGDVELIGKNEYIHGTTGGRRNLLQNRKDDHIYSSRILSDSCLDNSFENLNEMAISASQITQQSSFLVDMAEYHDTFMSNSNEVNENSLMLGESVSMYKNNVNVKADDEIDDDVLLRNKKKVQDILLHQQNLDVDVTHESDLEINHPNRSEFDSFVIPRLNYFSIHPTREDELNDESFQLDHLAMKYLPDEMLSKQLNNSGTTVLRENLKQKNLLTQVLIANQFDEGGAEKLQKSDKTLFGIPTMSFASKQYLQRHGLLTAKKDFSESGRRNMDKTDENGDYERILDLTALKMQPKLL